MIRIVLLLLCFLSIKVYAQQSDTLVTYAINGIPTKKVNKATSIYKLYKKDSTTWVKTTSDHNFQPLVKETFSDSSLTILHGSYLKYHDGKIYLKGTYYNNERTGVWLSYNATGKASSSTVYLFDKPNGRFTEYWDNGSIKQEGTYLNSKKTGEWKMFYESGELALKETYDAHHKLTDSSYLSINGNAILKDSIITAPNYPNGIKMFYKYLANNIKYPLYAAKNNIQGKVYLSFIVSEKVN